MRFSMASNLKYLSWTLLLLTACSHQNLQFYMLEPASTASPTEPLSSAAVVGLGPIHLPEYLNRPQMVTAIGEHQYRFDEQNRWAERLEDNVSRVLAQDLQTSLGLQQLVRHPWSQRQVLDYQIAVDVLSFHYTERQDVELKAQWQVRQGDRLAFNQRFDCRLPAPDRPEAIVATQSQCVQALATQLATAISELAVNTR